MAADALRPTYFVVVSAKGAAGLDSLNGPSASDASDSTPMPADSIGRTKQLAAQTASILVWDTSMTGVVTSLPSELLTGYRRDPETAALSPLYIASDKTPNKLFVVVLALSGIVFVLSAFFWIRLKFG